MYLILNMKYLSKSEECQIRYAISCLMFTSAFEYSIFKIICECVFTSVHDKDIQDNEPKYYF